MNEWVCILHPGSFVTSFPFLLRISTDHHEEMWVVESHINHACSSSSPIRLWIPFIFNVPHSTPGHQITIPEIPLSLQYNTVSSPWRQEKMQMISLGFRDPPGLGRTRPRTLICLWFGSLEAPSSLYWKTHLVKVLCHPLLLLGQPSLLLKALPSHHSPTDFSELPISV